jgi:hypothetical protein
VIPEIETIAANLTSVKIGKVTVWFSYTTPVACDSPDYGFVASKNIWSQTTGKHLNTIDSRRDQRISNERFTEILDEVCR